MHGACIGAGIEIAAFAGRVEAREGTRIRLPELSMGLVPGAGGTVSLPRRIGQWRTAFLVLAGIPVELPTALAWGPGRCPGLTRRPWPAHRAAARVPGAGHPGPGQHPSVRDDHRVHVG
jgi:hypothetical protein